MKKYCFVQEASSQTITSFLIYVSQSFPPLPLDSIFFFLVFCFQSVLLLCVSIFLLVTHLFPSRFKLSRSFYIVHRFFSFRYFAPTSVVDFPSDRFFSSRSPIISLSASCPSSFWYTRLSAASTLISPLTQSLSSCSFLFSATVDLSLLPTCRPPSLRFSLSFSFFLRVKFDPPPTRRTRSFSSQSVAGRPDCPQEVRHHRRRRRNRARAVRQVYGGDTKRKKRTHSNGYSRSITIPIR